MASEVWGIGFKTADTIAQAVGIPRDSPQRIKAGLQYTLSQATEDGHCYLPEPELIAKAAEILGVDAVLTEQCLEELAHDEDGVILEYVPAPEGKAEGEVTAVYLVPFHRAEVSLANGLVRLLQAPTERLPSFQALDWVAALGWLQTTTGSTLAPTQEEAVRLAQRRKWRCSRGAPA